MFDGLFTAFVSLLRVYFGITYDISIDFRHFVFSIEILDDQVVDIPSGAVDQIGVATIGCTNSLHLTGTKTCIMENLNL